MEDWRSRLFALSTMTPGLLHTTSTTGTTSSNIDYNPDLSHLTPEERTIIQGVLQRLKQEEEKEQEVFRKSNERLGTLGQQHSLISNPRPGSSASGHSVFLRTDSLGSDPYSELMGGGVTGIPMSSSGHHHPLTASGLTSERRMSLTGGHTQHSMSPSLGSSASVYHHHPSIHGHVVHPSSSTPLRPSSNLASSSMTAFPASVSHQSDHHQRLRYQRERFHNIHQHYSLSSEEDFNRHSTTTGLHRKSSTTPEPFSSLSQGDDDYSYSSSFSASHHLPLDQQQHSHLVLQGRPSLSSRREDIFDAKIKRYLAAHPQSHLPPSTHLPSHPLHESSSSPIHSPYQRLRYRRERFHQQHFSLSSSEDDSLNMRRHRNFHSAPEYQATGPYSFSIASSGVGLGGDEDYSTSYSSPFPGRHREEDILDAKIKRFLAHPITWTPSADGTKLIGHMILKKCPGIDDPASPSLHSGSSAAQLGLKIVGGRITLGGTVGAVIEKVKRGSIADTVGRLRPGDEVLEWNGRSLEGSTFEEAYDIMAESRQEPQVELIVCRHLRRVPMPSPVPAVTEVLHEHTVSPTPLTSSPIHHHLRQDPSSSHLRRQRPHPLLEAYSEPFYSRSLDADDDGRPSFRKAMSQPTHQFSHRSMSPSVSLRSPSADMILGTSSTTAMSPPLYHHPHRQPGLHQDQAAGHYSGAASRSSPASLWAAHHPSILPASSGPITAASAMSTAAAAGLPLSMSPSNKKRQLPQVPSNLMTRRSTAAFVTSRRLSSVTQAFHGHRGRASSTAAEEAMTPMGMYSDSEVTTSRPSYASERLFYAHPASRPTSSAGNQPPSANRHHHHRHHRGSRADTSRRASSLARSMFSPTEPETFEHQQPMQRQEPHLDDTLADVRFESRNEQARRESMEFIPRRSRRGQLLERRYDSEGGVGSRDIDWKPTSSDRPHASYASFEREKELEKQQHQREMMRHHHQPGLRYEDQEDSEALKMTQQQPRGSMTGEGSSGPASSSSRTTLVKAGTDTTTGSPGKAQPVARRGAITGGMKVQRSLDESGRSVGARGSGTALHHSSQERLTGHKDVSLSDTALSKSVAGSEEQLDEVSSEGKAGEDVGSDSGSKTGGVRTKTPAGGSSSKLAQLTGSKEGDLNKIKSSSTSQLSSAGTKKRLGFRKKTATSFTVQRSEEVAPDEVRHLVKQVSSASSDGEGSITGDSWVPAMRLQAEGDVSVFVEGLGPGQLVGRQALASVNYGDIQLSICERKGNIEVEVIRARNLMVKQHSRILPATYVKVHMWKHRKCVAKARTTLARRTLDPLYQQQLIFHEDFREAVLQIVVWGDYGKLDRKYFMGMAQVCLDDLDLSNIVIGWYKLFPQTTATLTNLAPSTALQEAREAKMAQMAANMSFFGE